MTSLFRDLLTVYCPDCHRIVVVTKEQRVCPLGHPLAKPATILPEEPRMPDVRERQAKESAEQE